ncbi:TetR/AcrR family transcriptional regulator [Streptomyces sp. NPDC048639]|uniref:TetR/AcrR family transcriptional regulator n=1 Tax=Streptomyces sp. NPDC048639 TaxID=3365581 RepID=UPI003721699E
MPKEPASKNHRDKLLDGALICLREKGYARTTARDIADAAGASLGSIGYHFGGVDALLDAALGQCVDAWTQRMHQAISATAGDEPRARLEAALVALIDSFEELRPLMISYIEAFPPAVRSTALRARLAAGYTYARPAGNTMAAGACTDTGIAPPPGAETIPSLLIAICEGLMLQWLVDPDSAPSAHQVLDALSLLAPHFAPAA